MTEVRDHKAQNRFELDVEGAMAFANYRLAPSTVIITHTETPRALRGRGIASELVAGRAGVDPCRWIKGGRRLRLCGGLPAQASRVRRSDRVTPTSSGKGRGRPLRSFLVRYLPPRRALELSRQTSAKTWGHGCRVLTRCAARRNGDRLALSDRHHYKLNSL